MSNTNTTASVVSEATARPWVTNSDFPHHPFNVQAGDFVYRPHFKNTASPAELQANAALIVKAVNSYEALVKALSHFIEAYDNKCIEIGSQEIDLGDGTAPHPWHEEWLHHARDALAGAK